MVSGLFTTVATCQTERRVLFGIGRGGKKRGWGEEWFPGIAHKKGGRKTIGYKA